MKLVFPAAEHAPVELDEGATTIGSDAGCRIVLASPAGGIAPRHCEITLEAGAASVRPLDATAPTVLNGRQIGGITPIKDGDLLVFGRVGCSIVGGARKPAPAAPVTPSAKAVAPDDDGRTRVRAALPRFMLRGVSGTTFGKTFAVTDNAVIEFTSRIWVRRTEPSSMANACRRACSSQARSCAWIRFGSCSLRPAWTRVRSPRRRALNLRRLRRRRAARPWCGSSSALSCWPLSRSWLCAIPAPSRNLRTGSRFQEGLLKTEVGNAFWPAGRQNACSDIRWKTAIHRVHSNSDQFHPHRQVNRAHMLGQCAD